ncbi:MAG TPA: tRNA glutamyl-Q(34) synthetase GluQRS [Bauldia sp.]|nr:tRNA glutamyl-Q(34) synthetase GluQRS [Bauldia sp.]
MQPVFRFAPSPNGELHLGHAFSALTDYAQCQAADGRFLLRIEDIDRGRCRPEYEHGIYRDLAWLGLTWEEPVRRQSEHGAEYRKAINALRERGLVYPAFLSRAELATMTADPGWPRDPDGAPLYPDSERKRLSAADIAARTAAGQPHTLRLDMTRAIEAVGATAWHEDTEGTVVADPAAWGDVILARRDAEASYHLAVVVDDDAQGVTNVVRGRDLYYATAVHVVLQRLLGLPTPRYHHHRLITDAAGRKLSKSDRDTSLRALREGGATPADIRRMVGL